MRSRQFTLILYNWFVLFTSKLKPQLAASNLRRLFYIKLKPAREFRLFLFPTELMISATMMSYQMLSIYSRQAAQAISWEREIDKKNWNRREKSLNEKILGNKDKIKTIFCRIIKLKSRDSHSISFGDFQKLVEWHFINR